MHAFRFPAALAGLALVSVLAAACGSAASTPTTAPIPTAAPATAAPASEAMPSSGSSGAVVVNVAGGILVGPTGMALYTKGTDPGSCTAGCLAAWPPLTVPSGGSASAGSGVTGAVATVTRSDGTVQVTYKGLPLYYFASDSTAGTATGDGVGGFSVAKP
ncbi:MAG TPA: hypothetical protein VKR30_04545 [Candidatus Limnocylindrales bacterium]|nr:hypothetical protein [Candidatus Limnocylindrales bacterium]